MSLVELPLAGSETREGKHCSLFFKKKKKISERVRGSGVESVRVLNFPASPARSYMSLMQCDAGPQPRAKAKLREHGDKFFFSAYSIRDILAGQDRRRALVARHQPAWQLT